MLKIVAISAPLVFMSACATVSTSDAFANQNGDLVMEQRSVRVNDRLMESVGLVLMIPVILALSAAAGGLE